MVPRPPLPASTARLAESRVRLAALLILACLPALPAVAEELPPAPPGSFSIVVVPDTQRYLGRGTIAEPESTAPVTNPVFDAHTRWITENIERQRIVFVSHAGDIVDLNVSEQWEVARSSMDRLHGRVPYAISVGNHDMLPDGDSSLFQRYFPRSHFEGFAWYGGSFDTGADSRFSGNNANSFQLFSTGGMDFIFLHLECNAPDAVLAWASRVLRKHSNRRALIMTHMGLGPLEKPVRPEDFHEAPKGRMRWHKVHGSSGNSPEEMWQKCFRKHANLFAIFSGDQRRTQARRRVSRGEHGNSVHELLQDYGSGYLRIYRFLPASDVIQVLTYNTSTRELCSGTQIVPARDEHQFTLRYEMSPPALER